MYRKSVRRDGFVRVEDGAYIPPNPDNMDYVKVLEWFDAGNSPEIVPEPEPTHEQQKNDEYVNDAQSSSILDVVLTMVEACVKELDARGKPETEAFHEAVRRVKRVSDKVRKPKDREQ